VFENLGQKSNFAESVDFIDHDPFEVTQEKLLSLKKTSEPLVSADKNVHTILNDFSLLSETPTQVQSIDLHLTMVTDSLANISGLQRQFFIQSDDQSPGLERLSQDPALINLLLFEMIGNRQQVSESFTTASGRGDVMGLVVLGLERRKQAILNVSGSVDVISLEILRNSLMQWKVTERRQSQTGFGWA
jgi:hypothetical protein